MNRQGETYALTLNLNGATAPRIVPLGELYELTADLKAVRLKLSKGKEFNFKNKEYGRKVVVNGDLKMVRHVIFDVSGDVHHLQSLYEDSNNKKRFVGFKRKSISPIVESLDTYTFPDDRKDMRSKKKEKKKSSSSSKKTEADRIYDILKKNKSSKSHVGEDGAIAASSSKVPVKESTCGSNMGSSAKLSDDLPTKSSKLHGQDDLMASKESCKDHSSSQEKSHPSGSKNQLDKCSVEGIHSSKSELDTEVLSSASKPNEADAEMSSELTSGRDVEMFKIASTQNDFHELKSHLSVMQTDLSNMKSDLSEVKSHLSEIKSAVSDMKIALTEMKVLFLGLKVNDSDEKVKLKTAWSAKDCAISKLSNLIQSDEEDVDEDQIKIDCDKYVSKKAVARIVRKFSPITTRIEKLCDLFFEDKPGNYSLSGWGAAGKALIKITDNEVNSMIKILNAMTWSKKVEITEKAVRVRISKYTSEARNEVPAQDVDKKIQLSKKRPTSSVACPGLKKKKTAESGQSKAIDVKVEKHALSDSEDPKDDSDEETNRNETKEGSPVAVKSGFDEEEESEDEEREEEEGDQINVSIHLE